MIKKGVLDSVRHPLFVNCTKKKDFLSKSVIKCIKIKIISTEYIFTNYIFTVIIITSEENKSTEKFT